MEGRGQYIKERKLIDFLLFLKGKTIERRTKMIYCTVEEEGKFRGTMSIHTKYRRKDYGDKEDIEEKGK